MQGDLFIPESWTKVTTWVEEIQLMAMKNMGGKSSRIWCTIECIKHHHEYHKYESFYLTPSLLLDFICNLRHKLKLDLLEFKKLCKEKLHAKKGKKMAHVNPYKRM
jgi:hypothetical protein